MFFTMHLCYVVFTIKVHKVLMNYAELKKFAFCTMFIDEDVSHMCIIRIPSRNCPIIWAYVSYLKAFKAFFFLHSLFTSLIPFKFWLVFCGLKRPNDSACYNDMCLYCDTSQRCHQVARSMTSRDWRTAEGWATICWTRGTMKSTAQEDPRGEALPPGVDLGG